MSPDKVLQKIQVQIDALAPTLELFIEHTIQPTVSHCEELQKQLSELQENISVYKYLRANKEISPSFNIHAKVSEKEAASEPIIETLPEVKDRPSVEEIKATLKEDLPPAPVESSAQDSSLKNIQVAINDKFRFINELFSQNPSEYGIAMEQLNNLKNWNDSEVYLNSLKALYSWKDSSELVKQFYAVVKKRFN